MYTMLEIFENIKKTYNNSFEKSMGSDFYLGMQMACDKILTMMAHTEELSADPWVKDIAQCVAEATLAYSKYKAPSERKK